MSSLLFLTQWGIILQSCCEPLIVLVCLHLRGAYLDTASSPSKLVPKKLTKSSSHSSVHHQLQQALPQVSPILDVSGQFNFSISSLRARALDAKDASC